MNHGLSGFCEYENERHSPCDYDPRVWKVDERAFIIIRVGQGRGQREKHRCSEKAVRLCVPEKVAWS